MRPDEAERVVAVAVRAPSLHNTQPWMFSLLDGALELRADLSRRLPGTDPDGRQMFISCGAALFGARLGVRALDRLPHVDLLPDPAQPDLVARIHLRGAGAAGPEVTSLLRALPWRCSLRFGFGPGRVPAGLLAAMRRAAAAERAVLLILDDPGRKRAAADLVAAADHLERTSPEAARELEAWTSRLPADADGVPPWAYPSRPGRAGSDELLVRDFARDTGSSGRPSPAPSDGPVTAADPPVAAALLTGGDAPADWMAAGQALHRVLLTAAAGGVQASLHSQPFGSAELRRTVREELTGGAEPQLLLQFGYPAGRDAMGPATPRRPVAEVLRIVDDRSTGRSEASGPAE
jgi:hypothetical protein